MALSCRNYHHLLLLLLQLPLWCKVSLDALCKAD
jgi:hypothetical protein